MLVKEFKRGISSDIKSFIDEKQVEFSEGAARLADDYGLTYKVSFLNKSSPSRRPCSPQSGSKPRPVNPSSSSSLTFSAKPKLSSKKKDKIS